MNKNIKKLILIATMIFIVSMCTSGIISASEPGSNETEISENNLLDELSADESADPSEITDIYVNSDAENMGNGSEDQPFKSIKEAIEFGNAKQNPVTVRIASGTYPETNMTITNNMVIKSYNGEVTLDANNNGWFFYSNNASNNLSLIGLTFKNGINYDFYDSTVGGVVKTEGHIDVVNCTFENNFGGTGGGINSHNGANIINSTFKNNKAEYNGACIYNIYGQTNIINCNFHNNTAKRQGGAVRVQGNTYIENSTFTDNYAGTGNYAGDGGAVRVTDGDLNIESSTFRNNSAKFSGGAVSAGDDSQYSTTHYQLNINNSTFTDNKARTGAGIIANDGINLTNSVLANNSVPESISARYGLGAGVYVLNGNSILVGNTIENNTNPYNRWDKEDVYSYQGNVAADGNNWGPGSNPRIKTNYGKTTNEVTSQPTVNKPTITIQTGEKNKKADEPETQPHSGGNNQDNQNTQTSNNTKTNENTNSMDKFDETTQITRNIPRISKKTTSSNDIKQTETSHNTIKANTTTTESQNMNTNSGEKSKSDQPTKAENGSNSEQIQESSEAHELSAIKSIEQNENMIPYLVLVIIAFLALAIGYKKQKEY